jgi:Leucine-rich repeat (LRR) protein
MDFLAQISTLKALDIGITQITGPSLEALESLENLEELSLGGNRVSDLGLSYLQSLPNLRRLDLSGSQITDSGVWGVTVTDVNIETIAQLSSLEELNLAASNQQYIADIGDGVPRLRNRIEITDLGAAKLTALTGLRGLNLTRSEVTAKGIAELAKLPHLEALTLAHAAKLGDSAAPAIAGLEQLRILDLTGVEITDQGLLELAELPALEKLIIPESKVTQEGVDAFRARKPNCHVTW